MVSEKLIEEAMDGRYDGINACDIAREVLELESLIKVKDGLLSRWLARNEELTEQLDALKKTLHEECALSAQTIRLLQERINDKDAEITDLHDTIASLEEALKGK